MRNSFNKKRGLPAQAGFTLIELLVVIAIIGMLSSVILASLNGARKKGRDARRQADLKQLQVALELYYSNNGGYPPSPTVTATKSAFDTALAGLVSEGDIPIVPTDPLNSSTNLYYYKTTAAVGSIAPFYCLGTNLETTPVPISSCNYTASGFGSQANLPTGNYVVGP